MHSSLPQQLANFEFTQSKMIRQFFNRLEYWVLKYASAVITICPDLENHVAELFPESGSVLIENVVDYNTIFGEQDRSGELMKTLGLTGKHVALYTGTLEAYQGLDLLIQSATHVVRKNPKVIFLVVGGHPDQVNHYYSKVKYARLSSHFIFTGQVRPEEISSYIHCADVLVTPRISGTNTPLKIYAYLRSGVPIVATRIWTHTQVLDERTAQMTEPDPKEFASGIIKVLSDHPYRNALVCQAKAMARDRYSYSRYLQQMTRVIHLALQRGV